MKTINPAALVPLYEVANRIKTLVDYVQTIARSATDGRFPGTLDAMSDADRQNLEQYFNELRSALNLAEQPGEAKQAKMDHVLIEEWREECQERWGRQPKCGDDDAELLIRMVEKNTDCATLSAQLAAICEAVRDAVEDNFDSTQPLPRWAIDLHNKAAAAMGGAK